MTTPPFDPKKYDHPLQVGGIRTGRYDYPEAGGGPGCRIAWFETGTPFRFVVNLDRGGDIVEAWHGGTALAYLTPNGYAPRGTGEGNVDRWERGWNGGLVSTCGPLVIGGRQNERGDTTELHGAYHHTPAAVVAVRNPEPGRGHHEMSLELVTRITKLFGPVIEIRRTLTATLGQPTVQIDDTVTNLSNTPVEHHWLYHCNLGYPLLDEGAELVYAGKRDLVWGADADISADELARWKRVPGPLEAHRGHGERGVVVEPKLGADGRTCAALINPSKELGVALRFDPQQLPRLANWQHLGPGSYVTGIEPFNGSLMGVDRDPHPAAKVELHPGESRGYTLEIDVVTGAKHLDDLRSNDGPIAG